MFTIQYQLLSAAFLRHQQYEAICYTTFDIGQTIFVKRRLTLTKSTASHVRSQTNARSKQYSFEKRDLVVLDLIGFP